MENNMLRNIRLELGFSKEEFAKRLGISVMTLRDIETCRPISKSLRQFAMLIYSTEIDKRKASRRRSFAEDDD